MRKLSSLILFFLPVILHGQCHPEWNGILRNEVQGNTVILRNDTTIRECGMQYEMEVSWLDQYTLKWLEKEVGAASNCLCHYNFSVTVDSLAPADYHAKVFYRRFGQMPDCYIGTMRFRIADLLANPSPESMNPYQSPCFSLPVGISTGAGTDGPSMRIYPNPANDHIMVEEGTSDRKWMVIADPLGRIVQSLETREESCSMDLSSLTGRGFYLLTMIRDGVVFRSRFVKY
ncbi:MAG TPA: T9SS type A sorting domain-containing protein [Bacteroidales bacterium]|nr:T9SS type A sorting domain-containing protein [Bacteroidales bacterium]